MRRPLYRGEAIPHAKDGGGSAGRAERCGCFFLPRCAERSFALSYFPPQNY